MCCKGHEDKFYNKCTKGKDCPCKCVDLKLVTVADINLQLTFQKNACKVCEKEFSTSNSMCVDLSYPARQLRGILCEKCTAAIRLLERNPRAANRLLKYITTGV